MPYGLDPFEFPRLSADNSRETSPRTITYNCIALAAGDSSRWWPDADGSYYWPPGIPREVTLAVFQAAFEQLGYEPCTDGRFQRMREKVAIFVDEKGKPQHAARQDATGLWISKMGGEVDIIHDLDAVEGPKYGKVGVFMSRPTKLAS